MRRLSVVIFAMLLVGFGLQSFTLNKESTLGSEDIGLKMPKKVDAIIQNKCYGCHSANGKSDKAKEKLMWDELTSMNPSQQVEKLKAIGKVLSEGAMPPKKMVEKMPEKKLTEKETKIMSKWASKGASKLSKLI